MCRARALSSSHLCMHFNLKSELLISDIPKEWLIFVAFSWNFWTIFLQKISIEPPLVWTFGPFQTAKLCLDQLLYQGLKWRDGLLVETGGLSVKVLLNSGWFEFAWWAFFPSSKGPTSDGSLRAPLGLLYSGWWWGWYALLLLLAPLKPEESRKDQIHFNSFSWKTFNSLSPTFVTFNSMFSVERTIKFLNFIWSH